MTARAIRPTRAPLRHSPRPRPPPEIRDEIAAAWGSHVNEGVVEWPPCPWRLCRALVAAWHWKHRKGEAALHSLIEKLSAEPPSYRLPKASTAHPRHYMPVIEGKKETKTKVFDTFVHVSVGESLWIRWDADLTDEESALLSKLLESISYLGRAECLVSAALHDTLPVNGDWSRPLGQDSSRTHETIRLLAPQPPWHDGDWAAAQSTSAKAGKTKSKKKTDTLPHSLFDALQTDTADWKKEGWNLPPGARWLEYTRPRDGLKVAPPARLRPADAWRRPPSLASRWRAKFSPPSRSRSASSNAFTKPSANCSTAHPARRSPAWMKTASRSLETSTPTSCPNAMPTATSRI